MKNKTIIIGTDLSSFSKSAIKVGLQWAQSFNMKPIVVHVCQKNITHTKMSELRAYSVHEESDLVTETIKKYLKEDIEKLNFDSNNVEIYIEFGDPAEEIISCINKNKGSLLVLGTKGHSIFEELLLGSLTEKMIRISPISVLAVKDTNIVKPKTMTMLCDFSQNEHYMVNWAKEISHSFQTKITLLHAVTPATHIFDSHAKEANNSISNIDTLLAKARQIAIEEIGNISKIVNSSKTEVKVSIHTEATPSKFILQEVEENPPDLLLMGTHGRSGLKKWLMGSTAEILTRRLNCSQLIVRPIV